MKRKEDWFIYVKTKKELREKYSTFKVYHTLRSVREK